MRIKIESKKKKKEEQLCFKKKLPNFVSRDSDISPKLPIASAPCRFSKHLCKRFLRLYHYSPLKALTSLIFHIFVLRTRALSSQASATSKKIRSSCFLGRLQPSVARWFFTVGTGGQRRSALTRREPIM